MRDHLQSFTAGETVAGRYRILEVAGVGGMGIVLRAVDEQQQRPVALKVLPEELSQHEADKARLAREARMASSLAHPNIGTIYGIEQTTDGGLYLVMPFYEGGSLAQWVRRTQPSHREILRAAIQIARGLGAAHAKSIIHRDIKPSNILMAAGDEPKIVDFGIAYMITGETVSRTESSGTIAYMSPEQVMARSVDACCDIWALGVVLAELLTGRHPFQRDTLAGIVYAILYDAPQHLDTLPPNLQTILFRMLAKEPGSRYGSTSVLVRDLETALEQLPAPDQPSLAPTSRTSTQTRAQIRKLRALAARAADSSRATHPLWRRAGMALAALLLLALATTVAVPRWRHRALAFITNAQARHASPLVYQNYLTAQNYIARYDKQGNLDKATALLQKAVGANPHFGAGYAELSEAYQLRSRLESDPADLKQAEAAANKAVQLDSSLPLPYVTLGYVHMDTGKHELALDEFRQALSIDPRNSRALDGVAHIDDSMGRTQQAEAEYVRAADLKPDNWSGFNTLAVFYNRHGMYPQAVAAGRRALGQTPDNSLVLMNLGAVYLDEGTPAGFQMAEKFFRKSLAVQPSYGAWANLGLLYYAWNRYPEAVQALQNALKLNANNYRVWDSLRCACEWTENQACIQHAIMHELPLVRNFMQSHPSDSMASLYYADLLAHSSHKAEALTYVQTTLTLTPRDPWILAMVADVEYTADEEKQAVKSLNQAFADGLHRNQAEGDPEAQALLRNPAVHLPAK